MGSLSTINKVIVIPTYICRFGSHTCFGYYILEESFRTLSKILHSVAELCGTEDLPCPNLSSHLSPDQDSVLLPLTRALSPKPKDSPVVTVADFLETEEQINKWISKLQQEEEKKPLSSGSNVI